MTEKTENSFLETEKLVVLMRKYAVPCVIFLLVAAFIYLQSLGKAFLSAALSMIREILFGVGFAVLLPIWFSLDGVLYSMPASDILTFVISSISLICTYHSLNRAAANAKSEPQTA